jgi:hypothetical protein
MDIDRHTKRDLGDMLALNLAPTFNYRGASLGIGYAYQYQGADSYSGGLYSPERYSWLGKNSLQTMNAFMGKVGYDTITLYREKKFPVPLLLSMTHTRILSGKNVVRNPLTTFDFSMFF